MSLIDTSKPLSFTFDGKAYQGFEGDTLSSALLRNGVRVVGRSFKYHRPRGIFSAGSEEPNALVEIHAGDVCEPNRRATTIKLFEGLTAKSQNCWPSVHFDLMAVNDLFAPFFAAGFYYKTFMWPRAFWEKLYEPMIRRAAGLGRLSNAHDPDHYDKGFLFADMLIIGAGPVGLWSALHGARAGLSVILADEDFELGGQLLSNKVEVDGQSGLDWVGGIKDELASLKNVRILKRTTVFGVYDHGTYGALENRTDKIGGSDPKQILWRIRAQNAILATGATERSMAFANNDRPGVMLAGAMQTYHNRFGVSFDGGVTSFINNNSVNGLEADKVIDSRNSDYVSDVVGRKGVKAIKLASGENISARWLAVSGGWNPNIQLTCHKRGRPVWDDKKACFMADAANVPTGMKVVGSAAGDFQTHDAIKSAKNALSSLGVKTSTVPKTSDGTYEISPFWHVKGKKRSWVDLQNDVTAKDIILSHQEGFSSVEHLKRYTTLGMATDQGKTSNILGLAIMAEASGRTIPETGTTMFRPPYNPVSIGAFAGRHRGQDFKPVRQTPSHQYGEEIGATFVESGYWKRAQWFAKPGEKGWRDSVDREVLTTRNAVGICDVSTLGKIDIQGRDAGKFLNKVYVNTFSTLKPGKCRYGLMLREDGIAFDDGTCARFSDTHFVMTTTTANAVRVFRHLEFARQCLWPDMDVHLISTTEQWAQYAVAGPKARELLQEIVDPEFDISNEAFPYMACSELTICGGIRARLFRLSFSGELAYEIAVPTRYGDSLVRLLHERAKTLGGDMYGLEALGVMRIEKGHPAGNELNGQTTARSLGLGGFVSKKKDCIGKVLSNREALTDENGLSLVGFVNVNPEELITNGAHFFDHDAYMDPENDLGYMSSVAWSPMLERYIGLGFLKNGKARLGETVTARNFVKKHHVELEIVSPHFFDPDGERLRV